MTDTSTWKKVPAVFDGVAVQLSAPPPELDELELLELEELELEELLLEDELEDDDELLDDELLEELELEELDELLELLLEEELELEDEVPPLIEPAEAVRVTLSSREPSSRLTIRSVCAPAARLVKVAGVIVP